MSYQNSEFVEKLIIRGLSEYTKYAGTVITALQSKFFSSQEAATIYEIIKEYYEKYKSLPNDDIIIGSCREKQQKSVKSYLEEIRFFDFNIADRYDYLIDETDVWLKESAVKIAIMQCADIIEKGDREEYSQINDLIKKALTTTIKIDLGTDYFNSLKERLALMFDQSQVRIPTFFPIFDELICGGFPPQTLSIGYGKIHGFKSQWMINVACRQVLKGYNVVLFSLEMSEHMFAQRVDAIYSKLDINRIYVSKKNELISALGNIKKTEGRGNLFIKQFAPGTSSVNDFRAQMHEMKMRDIPIDIFYCDYVNLMKPSYRSKDSMYLDIKRISEELRAITFEFNIPGISVSQFNRTGMGAAFEALDLIHASESTGLGATADFIMGLGVDEDSQIYNSEVHYKIIKNRLGGRVGDIGKFLIDPRSLKMYCPSEEQEWINDATYSGNPLEYKHGNGHVEALRYREEHVKVKEIEEDEEVKTSDVFEI